MNDVNSKFRKVYLFEKKLANFTSKSGETLFCRHLIPKNGLAKVKYHFFLVHGAVEHSLRHSPLIEKFKSKYKDEMVLSYYDHYGHGKSSGVRAYVESVNLYSKDFENFVSESLKVTEEKENIQKVVIAHSMGGLIVLNSILNDYEGFSDKFDSLVLSNPCIKPKIDLPAAVSDLVESLPEALEKVRLPLIYNGYGLSNDPERANDFDMDPLVSKFMTVKLGFEILKCSKKVRSLSYYLNKKTLFLLSDNDVLCDTEITRLFISGVDKSLITIKDYSNAKHEIFNEVQREDVFNDMIEWISQGHLSKVKK